MDKEQLIVDYVKVALEKGESLTNHERELGNILVQIWENKHFIEVEDLKELSYFIYKQKWNKQYYL